MALKNSSSEFHFRVVEEDEVVRFEGDPGPFPLSHLAIVVLSLVDTWAATLHVRRTTLLEQLVRNAERMEVPNTASQYIVEERAVDPSASIVTNSATGKAVQK